MSPADTPEQARLDMLPPPAAAPNVQRRLVERFRLTIPHRRPVVVTYLNAVFTEVWRATGLPEEVRMNVIQMRLNPQRRTIIPIACIIDIQPLYPQRK
jgi:hypothetical protein